MKHKIFRIVSFTILVISVFALWFILVSGRVPKSITDEIFGLRLNEKYSPMRAIDILHQNTGHLFKIESEDPYELVGYDISFAGHSWENLHYYFDYASRLHRILFEQHYYCPHSEFMLHPQYEEHAKALYFSIINGLKKKYGEGKGEWWSKAWTSGSKVVWANYSRWYDDGALLHRGAVSVFTVTLEYYDLNATATSADML